jgi:hypothetical protein
VTRPSLLLGEGCAAEGGLSTRLPQLFPHPPRPRTPGTPFLGSNSVQTRVADAGVDRHPSGWEPVGAAGDVFFRLVFTSPRPCGMMVLMDFGGRGGRILAGGRGGEAAGLRFGAGTIDSLSG